MGAFVRTALLFVVLAGLFALIGAIVGYFFSNIVIWMAVMVLVIIMINVYAFVACKKRVLKHHRVRIITEHDDPRLYNIVRNTAVKAGLPMPEVGITQNPAPNAFATGRGPKDAAVVATSGLLAVLSDEELEGVMAHELAHVKNRDIMIMSIVAVIAGAISFIATRLIWFAVLGGRRDNGVGLAIALLGWITLPIAAMLIQMSVSRGREFAADSTGAKITGKPLALASALRRIETGVRRSPPGKDGNDYPDAHMWIEAPAVGKKGFSSLFRTHPPMDKRIERLEKMAGKADPYTSPENPFL